jgi:hypothetical protein
MQVFEEVKGRDYMTEIVLDLSRTLGKLAFLRGVVMGIEDSI